MQSKLNHRRAFIPKKAVLIVIVLQVKINKEDTTPREGKASSGKPRTAPVLYGLRLLFWGLLARSLGRCCQFWILPVGSQQGILPQVQAHAAGTASAAIVQTSALKLTQEIMPLKTVVQQMAAKIPIYQGVFL